MKYSRSSSCHSIHFLPLLSGCELTFKQSWPDGSYKPICTFWVCPIGYSLFAQNTSTGQDPGRSWSHAEPADYFQHEGAVVLLWAPPVSNAEPRHMAMEFISAAWIDHLILSVIAQRPGPQLRTGTEIHRRIQRFNFRIIFRSIKKSESTESVTGTTLESYTHWERVWLPADNTDTALTRLIQGPDGL